MTPDTQGNAPRRIPDDVIEYVKARMLAEETFGEALRRLLKVK